MSGKRFSCAGWCAVAAAFLWPPPVVAQQTTLRSPVPGTGSWTVVENGGFETGSMTGWSISGASAFGATDAEAFVGDFSAVTMTAGPSGPGYGARSTPVTVVVGETYVLSAFILARYLPAGEMYLDLSDIPGEPQLFACIERDEWVFASMPWTATRSPVTIRMVRDGVRGADDLGYFDEVALTLLAEFSPPDSTYFCYADCSPGGSVCTPRLDFFDFLCYQNAFAAGDAYADCDESGALDFFDFLCFQDAFASGCP